MTSPATDCWIAAAIEATPGQTAREVATDLGIPRRRAARTLGRLADDCLLTAMGTPPTYRPAADEPAGFDGTLLDDHPLSALARGYGEWVIASTRWPLTAVDPARISWQTSTRASRRHGLCAADGDGGCIITLSEHTYERAGFAACRETVRHELVHAWQYQHTGSPCVRDRDGTPRVGGDTTDRPAAASGRPPGARSIEIEPGHGPSFRAWTGPLALDGRCSRPYERTRDDYAYVVECPACRSWSGRHRLCPTVRAAAHGTVGPSGYRYCRECQVLVQLRHDAAYLEHAAHDDAAIRAFVADEPARATTTSSIDAVVPVDRPI